jgi:uncharacterized membrane protein
MNPILVVAIPLVLIVIGVVLNSFGLAFDQPASSPEQDPVKRLAAEQHSFRQFFDRQRRSSMNRQKHTARFAWLLFFATAASFIWFYTITVDKTAQLNRIASLQTLGSQEGKELILSVTLADGNNVKYIVKLPAADMAAAAKEPAAKETVTSWELEKLTTALSIGESVLPVGIALKIPN